MHSHGQTLNQQFIQPQGQVINYIQPPLAHAQPPVAATKSTADHPVKSSEQRHIKPALEVKNQIRIDSKTPTQLKAAHAGPNQQAVKTKVTETQKITVQPTPLVSPAAMSMAEPMQAQTVDYTPVETQQDVTGMATKAVSSSSSEFVFNPDPDFLAKINANIRQNNQLLDKGGQPIISQQKQQPVVQHINTQWLQEDSGEDDGESPEEEPEYLQQEEHMIDEDIEISDHRQDEGEEEQKVEGPLDERNEFISDCGSDIQIEEEKNSDVKSGPTEIVEQEESSLINTEPIRPRGEFYVQGTQGDFKPSDIHQAQMSVF